MPQLIIIRGNAASGKSTLAKLLQQHLGENTLLLSQDLLRREMLLAHDGYDTPTIGLLSHLLHYGHNHCDIVILEGILNARWYRPIWQTIKQLYGHQAKAYYYDLSFEETLTRHTTRAKSKEFGEESLRRWWLEKDYLNDFNETLLTNCVTTHQALAMILDDLQAIQNA